MKGLLLLFLVCVLTSCEKEKVLVKEPKKSWTIHDGFLYDRKIYFSNYTNNEVLCLYGPNYLSQLDKKRRVTSWLMVGRTYPYGKKLPISENVVPSIFSDTLIFLGRTFNLGGPAGHVGIRDFSKDFSLMRMSSFLNGRLTMALNNKNQLLLPVQLNPNNERLILLDLDVSEDPFGFSTRIKIKTFQIIAPPTSIGDTGLYFIQDMGDDFIVSRSASTYKIGSTGQVTKINNQATYQLFTFSGKIFCIGFDNMIVSLDGGNSWKEFKNVPPEWRGGVMQPIGDSLIFSYLSKFFSVKIKDSGEFSLRELRNDGIEENEVTTLTNFNDSIYATTYSGVYYKSKKDFFDSKPKTN